ncbi:uncharacterized protein LOC113589342 [Electrophorus electricus]|uniref:uncharacterized protein LOC113589342 n=1 Tax=Electrophorus electricus TaxID=8005 RepID=UPI0015D06AED|nr:uncharacterized protein LOC113589342 [Electrophorus electricus]
MDPADCDAPPEEAPSNDACVPRRRSCAGSDTGLAAHDGTNGDANLVHSPEASKSRPLGGEAVRPCPGDSGHTVTCTVTIALAIPPESGKKPPNKVVSGGAGGTHKPQAYYHVEYNLLPDGEEPTRVDLVLFGSAAKVYAGNETKVLKPWQEGNDLWLAWSQSVKLSVTRQLLVKMPTHKITFRVWDLKDRVSAKARYDRLKAFRAPPGESPEEPDQAGGVKSLVCKLREGAEKQNPRNRATKSQRQNAPVENKSSLQINCSTDGNVEQKAIAAAPLCVAQSPGGVTSQKAVQRSRQSFNRYVHYGAVDNPGRTDVKKTDLAAVRQQGKDMAVSDEE